LRRPHLVVTTQHSPRLTSSGTRTRRLTDWQEIGLLRSQFWTARELLLGNLQGRSIIRYGEVSRLGPRNFLRPVDERSPNEVRAFRNVRVPPALPRGSSRSGWRLMAFGHSDPCAEAVGLELVK
jgi:hypothetical protein